MPVAAEIEHGDFYVNGIQGVIAISSGAGPATHVMNIGSRTTKRNFKLDKIPTQDGVTTATYLASMQEDELTIEFYPKGTSRATCIAEIAELEALSGPAVITIAQSGSGTQTPALTRPVGTWNLAEGIEFKEVREGLFAATIKLIRPQIAADGTFAALPLAS